VNIINVENLVKSFGDRKILNDVSFQVAKGEILFILGQSGTGKSVLLKCLVGLLTPDSGNIQIDQFSLKNRSEKDFQEVRRKCAMVFQNPALFDSLTIEENIAFGLKRLTKLDSIEINAKIKKVLDSVQLSQDILYKKPHEISFGQQKRVSLARSLVLEPEILLFDEPTTGLDPVSTTAINRLIGFISKEYKTTSLVVSHDMQCAYEIAYRVLFLDKGQVIYDDKTENVHQSQVSLVQQFFQEIQSR
jgi:phospholipid/cholesterol/gamma-HCH transport system ATP-binding protein